MTDRAWRFLRDIGCFLAPVCLFGGFLCAAGISRNDWRFIVLGGVLMLPYTIPASLVVFDVAYFFLLMLPLALWDSKIKPFFRKFIAR